MSKARMCPCTVLGAASQDLPDEVSKEVKVFFKMCLEKLVSQGLSPGNASEVLATIIGALVVANALSDTAAFDAATDEMVQQRDSLAA
jgi:TetR/AcrR family transcriptional repressor of nem operon